MTVILAKWITRQDLRDNPHKIYVFGDNIQRRGLGGQAKEMRGEPNAIGIPTKWVPSNAPGAIFADVHFEQITLDIEAAFSKLLNRAAQGHTIVWPKDGIGTGLAQLEQRAPRIWHFLEARRQYLFEAYGPVVDLTA